MTKGAENWGHPAKFSIACVVTSKDGLAITSGAIKPITWLDCDDSDD
jgi:hypothetical protein